MRKIHPSSPWGRKYVRRANRFQNRHRSETKPTTNIDSGKTHIHCPVAASLGNTRPISRADKKPTLQHRIVSKSVSMSSAASGLNPGLKRCSGIGMVELTNTKITMSIGIKNCCAHHAVTEGASLILVSNMWVPHVVHVPLNFSACRVKRLIIKSEPSLEPYNRINDLLWRVQVWIAYGREAVVRRR